jgi:glycosyltransferase involved in cell wall biosynthesis
MQLSDNNMEQLGEPARLESVMEIILITYNRSACLDNTLSQLADCQFAGCRMTVLDNCSTDDTPKITAKYIDKFPIYCIIRHPRNIGGDYNYLRAIELSTSLYTWILCDDDNYDFRYAQEVIDTIELCKYDLVYVASRSPDQLGWQGYGETTVKKLLEEGAKYYRGCTFWPAIIFKTSWYDTYCSTNAPYLYPSFKFINKSVNSDLCIFVAKHEIVIRTQTSISEIEPLVMYKEWVVNAAKIADKKIRRKVIEDRTDKGFMKTLFFWIALDRAKHIEGYWKRLVDILFALTPWQKIKFLTLFPVMIIPIPYSLLIRARELVYRFLGHKDVNDLPPVDVGNR